MSSCYYSIASRRLLLFGHCCFRRHQRNFSSSIEFTVSKSNHKSLGLALAGEEMKKKAIFLLKSEKDPARILSTCMSLLLRNRRRVGEGEEGGAVKEKETTMSLSHMDRSVLSVAVSALSSSKSYSSIRTLLLHSDLSLPNHHAIVLFGEANMIHDAISTFQRQFNMAQSSQSTAAARCRSFNALLFACIISNNHHLVRDLFRDYPARYRIFPDLTTYNTLLKAFCQSGSSLSAYSVFDEMSRNRIKSNLTSFSIALAGFYHEQRLDHVDRLLFLMKSKHNCRPGLSIYNIRIQSLCKLGRPNEAKQLLLKEMMGSKGRKPNSVTYGHLILGFCSVGDLEEAKELYAEMANRGLVPDSACFFTLIHYLCKGHEFESALQICRECMERNWVPRFSTMRQLVDGLVSISKTDEAREMVAMVKDKFPSHAQMWNEVGQRLGLGSN